MKNKLLPPARASRVEQVMTGVSIAKPLILFAASFTSAKDMAYSFLAAAGAAAASAAAAAETRAGAVASVSAVLSSAFFLPLAGWPVDLRLGRADISRDCSVCCCVARAVKLVTEKKTKKKTKKTKLRKSQIRRDRQTDRQIDIDG